MNIIWLDTIDSTNTEALRRLAELPSMTVLAARACGGWRNCRP